MDTIIQWNCRGLKSNFDELSLLINNHKPVAVCLQETFLKRGDDISIKYHSIYNKVFTDGEKARGGVSIIVSNNIPHKVISLNTNLQAVAIRLSLHSAVTLCSLYLPPSTPINETSLNDLITQLPSPFILAGDFNGHNVMWGCDDTNQRGLQLENFISKNSLSFMNDNKSKTYLHPATGSYSSIDLTLCSPVLLPNFTWKVTEDLCGSDHFPITFTSTQPSSSVRPQKWKLSKANWNKFEILCEQTITHDKFGDCDDPTKLFTSLLIDAAKQSVPQTSTNPKRPDKPWYNDDCKQAVKDRKQALRKFNLRPTKENHNLFRISRAKARRTIRENKRKAWRQYVSKLNSRTTTKKTWDMIRKINGKGQPPLRHLEANNTALEAPRDIADALAETFCKKSSPANYSEKFQRNKTREEKKKLNFNSSNSEHYNKLLTFKELKSALNKAHDSSPGQDKVHYQFLKHLPFTSLSVLLDIFNDIWQSGDFPLSWREALVIPIPKPGKDASDPANYRPIALTSCLCKTLERMVNDRLVWFLEKNNLIVDVQSGFRRQRGTIDHLVRFETFVREAFINRQHVVSVFFDLESAYDTTWKYGILKDLHDFGLRGRLPLFISAFLDKRFFRVRVGNTVSGAREQEMGVPQGCILSVTLFSVKINSIVKAICPGVDCSLYVDDFVICFRSRNMNIIERQLQQCLNKLQTWSEENGFKFSKSKTKCMHLCNLRGVQPDPELYLDKTKIVVVSEFKFLGVIFDKKLSFLPHITALKKKCKKALNLLKVVAHSEWGADRKVLLRLYRSLIRSKLDYGSIVYGSARKSYLKILDSIHNEGLRLVLGAFRTSPINSLYVEANEPSLSYRRQKLSLQYLLKLKSNHFNPTHKVVFKPQYKRLFERKPNVIPPFGIRMEPIVDNLGIDTECIADYKISEIPPWTLNSAEFRFDLASDKKSVTNRTLFHARYNEIKEHYFSYKPIYTDGSKEGNSVAAAAVYGERGLKCRLPDNSSIFSAEIKAIDLALNLAEYSDPNRFIIFSDSLSTLQALSNQRLENPLICNVLERISHLSTDNRFVFCWLPSHVGIKGNENADKSAKSALNLPISDFKVPYTDFKSSVLTHIQSSWQSQWDGDHFSKLHSVKPSLGEWYPSYRSVRQEEVIITRLRIGHSRLTHSWLLAREDAPECIQCNELLTIKHILLDCIDFQPIREKHYNADSMYNLFDTVSIDSIISFIKEIGLYKKL